MPDTLNPINYRNYGDPAHKQLPKTAAWDRNNWAGTGLVSTPIQYKRVRQGRLTIAEFSILNKPRYNVDGRWHYNKEPMVIFCRAFRDLASEICVQLKYGMHVLVEGQLRREKLRAYGHAGAIYYTYYVDVQEYVVLGIPSKLRHDLISDPKYQLFLDKVYPVD